MPAAPAATPSVGLPYGPLMGHSAVSAQLEHLINCGRLPHALILHGPRGNGKRVLANKLAYRLVCGPAPLGGPLDANDLSPAFALLQSGSHPDVHVLQLREKKASIGIEEVRGLLDLLKRSADGTRVAIIDGAEDLTGDAANALLKMLEEPRPGIVFVLVAHQLSQVLPTLRSRCRLLRLGGLSPAEQAQRAALIPNVAPPAGNFLQGLLHQLTQNPTLATSLTYQKLIKLQHQQAEYNLPTAWVQQVAEALAAPPKS